MALNKVFGIDLGTTYSCVAFVDEYGKAVTLKNADGNLTTPSVVYFESNDSQIVGEEAKTNLVMEPENTVAFIKREMGTDFRREIHGVSYSPQEISARILQKLVKDANSTLKQQGILPQDENVNKAVITCPAYFGLAEKEATRTAGQLAGLEVLDIINEPTAAAINYGVGLGNNSGRKTVVVYDLGGGTFDVTIMTVDGKKIDVVVTGGDPQLGGKDWDDALMKYFVSCWQEEMGVTEDISENLETRSALMESAEKAKKTLTAKETAKVVLIHEGERMKVELTRQKFDELTASLLERTIELTDSCFANAEKKGVTRDQIDVILLVGGSSRMPQVEKKLKEVYGKETALYDPDEAVAKGAALYAQQVPDRKGDIVGTIGAGIRINNVSSRTYGVAVLDRNNKDMISNFIFQNDKLPKSETQHFGTHSDNQEGALIQLYESTGMDKEIYNFDNAELVTSFDMKFNRTVPKGTPLNVTIRMENSGLIYIDAEEELYHSKLSVNYKVKNGLDAEEQENAARRTAISRVE